MSIFLQLAQKAVEKAGLGSMTAARRVRRVKQLPGNTIVRMLDPKGRRITVHFSRGQRHALVVGEIGNLPGSMEFGLLLPAAQRHYRSLFVRDVR